MLRSRPSTLRARLILLVAVAVIPVTAGILYAGLQQRRQAIAEVEREALALARSAASEENRLVVETRQLLGVFAQVPQVRRADPAECGAFLAQVMAEGERYANIGVIGADGHLRCSVLPFTPPVDLSHRRYFRRVLETHDFSVGEYQIGLVTRIASVNFGHPVLDAAGRLAAVVFVALPLTWLQERIAQAELPSGSEVLVMDGAGIVLAHYPEDEGWVGRSLAGTPLAQAVLGEDDEPIGVSEGPDGVPRLYATTALQDLADEYPVMVTVGIPTAVAYAPVNSALARNLGLLGLALLLVTGAAWWSSGTLVLRPVRALLLATQRLSDGDLGTRATTRGAPREIEELAASFNEMAATLQRHVREIQEHLGQISRLGRVRAVLSGINSAILRIGDRDELLREACRIAVEKGEFGLAWVAEVDPASREIRVVAGAAREAEEAEGAVPDALRGDGMVANALRTGTEVISSHPGVRGGDEEGGEQVGALGYRSAASLPLRVEDRVVASLNLYTTEANFFTEEEIRLMRELTADTSLALEYLEKEKKLHYLANYDPLTDLPNRSLFTDRLRQAIGRGRADHARLTAVLLLGIERFSEINATLGHQAGDLVIQTVASHLRHAAGETNTAARVGSQDFGVILAPAPGIRDIERFANELLETLPRTLTIGSEEALLSVRVGIAVFPHDGEEPEELIKAAALALEAAGSAPVQPVAFHSADLEAEARLRRKLEQELRTALAREELTLLYQPVVDLASGDPIGMEALVRWRNPDLGEVSPVTFIPLAEQMGIIREIGEWVLATAAVQGRRLHEEGLRELRMNVNVSVSQIRDPVFLENFTRIIEETGIDLSRLGIGIEITESELMENIEDAFAALETFRQQGMWIYIDDFGTGYSSLSYLRKLPINSLKIDRSFIQDIPGDSDAVVVVRSIIALARSLDLRVIAEGVETEDQLSTLRELGCDAGQGYLFSPALTAEDLVAFLTEV